MYSVLRQVGMIQICMDPSPIIKRNYY